MQLVRKDARTVGQETRVISVLAVNALQGVARCVVVGVFSFTPFVVAG